MFTKCKSCGVESRLASAFHKAAGILRVKLLCPHCWQKHQTSSLQLLLAANIILALFGLILLMLPASLVELRVIAVFCLIPPLLMVLLVPHEVGHVLAAQLLGLRVFSVSLGLLGRTLWKCRLASCTLEVKSLPFVGYTTVGHRSQRCLRLRHFLMVLAGPMANAALSAPVYLLLVTPNANTGTLLLHAFCWANLLMLPLNLWPRQISGLPSDGLQLLRMPFLPRTEVQRFHMEYFLGEGIDSLQREDWTAAGTWFERGLEAHPRNPRLLNALGVVFIKQGRFAAAYNLLHELLKRDDLDPVVRASILNNIAWANLHCAETNLLDEADRYSREGMEWLPWLAAFKGTRGSVLVELGRAEEGIPLLEDALVEYTEVKDKAVNAINACYLSIGYAKRGLAGEARLRLEEAQKFDPQCYLLPRVFNELRQADVGELE